MKHLDPHKPYTKKLFGNEVYTDPTIFLGTSTNTLEDSIQGEELNWGDWDISLTMPRLYNGHYSTPVQFQR